jgi:hypothetical protein
MRTLDLKSSERVSDFVLVIKVRHIIVIIIVITIVPLAPPIILSSQDFTAGTAVETWS